MMIREESLACALWTVADGPAASDEALADALGVSPVLARLIAARLDPPTLEAARRFVRPSLADLHSPWDLPDMRVAAERLARAIEKRETVVVHGDYDTDGVTATAILLQALEALGLPADHCLPCRFEDGYGISDEFVRQAIERKVGLVITVDCGVSEHERIAALAAAGVDVIVTDHHEPPPGDLPPALAVVDPKRADSKYPFRELVGAGVAFKLAWATCEQVVGNPRVGEHLREMLLGLLPLAAIGTIADVAPLLDENRVMVAFGLRMLQAPCPGLRALMDVANLRDEVRTARSVAFQIAPRLNAAGRMGNAELALELLLAHTPDDAVALAKRLDQENQARKKLCDLVEADARAAAARDHGPDDPILVLAGRGWHEGVIGIVSGRLAGELHRPVVVISLPENGGPGKGSGRSIEGVNLHGLLTQCRERFLSFGGHEQAAGFSVEPDQVAALRADLLEAMRREAHAVAGQPQIRIDCEIELPHLSEGLVRDLDLLEPFGQGNPAPCFLARGVRVAGRPRLLGAGQKHMSFNASQDGTACRCILFNDVRPFHTIEAGQRDWDIVFRAKISDYNGQVELQIDDMRPCGSP